MNIGETMKDIYLKNSNFCSNKKILPEPYKSLLKYAPKEGLILDAGCGSFTYTNFLKNYNDKIVCVDIFNPNMDEARKNNFLLASVENLPFKDNSFDYIFCLSVIQLIEDDARVINEFWRVLKKRGKLLFTVPTKRSIFWLLRELEIRCGVYKFPEFNVKHYHYYTRRKIQDLINNKFKLIDLHGYNFNFIPRLLTFLISIFRLEPLLRSIKSRLVKKKKNSNTIDKNMSRKANLQVQHKVKLISDFISYYFSDFSYHYIVVLERV